MELPKAYDPKQVEGHIYKLWEESGFFAPEAHQPRADNPNKNKTFSIVIPPPNITGSLHMGHALNTIIQDILIRQKRMQGLKTLWLPGTDHAGIATQNVVEKELKKEGLSRHDLGREKFIQRVWQWREKYGNIILDQLKKLGASCDWSRTRFTMDKEYQKAVKEAFLHYYKKGWIYQGERVINWCPRCQTSLSDLEIEYQEEPSNLWYIRYLLAKNSKFQAQNPKQIQNSKFKIQNSITVATTRPETMLGDTAVAVNPNDKRYKNLIGKIVILPLVNREIPIIADNLVDLKFGTGAVKVTPAHDLADYEIGLRHNLETIQVIDEKAKITKNAPLPYQDLTCLEARQKIVEDLTKLNLVEKIEPYSHRVAKCYRCGKTIEPLPSKQWFLKMNKLAEQAIKAVKNGKVKFMPEKWEKLYFSWLENIKDWCISRQIWWGHALPIWYCQIGKKSKIKNPAPKGRGSPNKVGRQKSKINKERYFISHEKPEKCPICGKCQPEQSTDVLDTWFSSALWPFATLGWPQPKIKNQKLKIKNDLKVFYPTDVLVTARDIINLWVARMIFSGLEFTNKKPFETVYIHATILTKEGKRMSKSLGTGIDPLNLIEKYGADATRFGIIWQESGAQDIHFGEEAIVAGRKFCNKLWNASRFILLDEPPLINADNLCGFTRIKNLTPADKKILNELNKIINSVNKDLGDYRFGRALQTIYDFFWHEFCDYYIEESKKQNGEKTQEILLYVLLTSLKLLHPFIPFITEEIYQKLPICPPKSARGGLRRTSKKECLMIEEWPSA